MASSERDFLPIISTEAADKIVVTERLGDLTVEDRLAEMVAKLREVSDRIRGGQVTTQRGVVRPERSVLVYVCPSTPTDDMARFAAEAERPDKLGIRVELKLIPSPFGPRGRAAAQPPASLAPPAGVDMGDLDPELRAIVNSGLKVSLSRARDGDFPIHTITVKNGERRAGYLMGWPDAQSALAAARQVAVGHGSEASHHVVFFCSKTRYEGSDFDAVIAECSVRDRAMGVMIAQRYLPRRGMADFETVGEPYVAGPCKNLLANAAGEAGL